MGESVRDFSRLTPTAPSPVSLRAGSGPPPGFQSLTFRPPPPLDVVAQQGLTSSPFVDPRYVEHGSSYVAPPALATASMTATSAGGAPGAQFGPPGVGGAPVATSAIFGLSPLVLGVIVVAGAYLAYRVLK
jgi:hypothetical protein